MDTHSDVASKFDIPHEKNTAGNFPTFRSFLGSLKKGLQSGRWGPQIRGS